LLNKGYNMYERFIGIFLLLGAFLTIYVTFLDETRVFVG